LQVNLSAGSQDEIENYLKNNGGQDAVNAYRTSPRSATTKLINPDDKTMGDLAFMGDALSGAGRSGISLLSNNPLALIMVRMCLKI